MLDRGHRVIRVLYEDFLRILHISLCGYVGKRIKGGLLCN